MNLMPGIDELKWLLKPLVNTNVMAAVFFYNRPSEETANH